MTLLSDKKGTVTVQTVIVIMAMMFLFSIVYTYAKLTIVASGVRNNVRNAVIQAVEANYYTAYDGMREGNTGAYAPDGSGAWQSDMTQGNIENGLVNFLSLKDSGGKLQKVTGGSVQYSISHLSVTARNDDLASNDKRLGIRSTYTLEIPVSFFLVKTQPITLPMTADVEFEEKF